MKKILIIVLLCSLVKVGAQTSNFTNVDSLLQKGRYKIALSKLKEMPVSFSSVKKIATIYDVVDDYSKAAAYYEKALQLKNDYAVKIKLAKTYKKQKELVKSINLFEEIAKEDTDNLLVNYELGKLYLQTRKAKKAKEIFTKLVAKDSKNANYSYKLGLAYALLKKRNLKINNFLSAYRKDDTHISAIHNLAMAFTKLRDKDSASIFIDRGLLLKPNHINLNKLKINNLYRAKAYKKAIKLLQHIDSLAPNDDYTHKMLGKSFYNLKEYEKAKQHFKKAVKLDYKDFKAHTYLGHIKLKQNEVKSAMFSYATATFIGKEPRDEAYLGLAKVYYEMKLPKRVIEQYKKAVEENGKNYDALYLLATFSDDYYKDKKIAYKLYKRYLNRFEEKNKSYTDFVKRRIEEVKKQYFLKGITLE